MIESATMADWERIYRDFDPEQPVTEHSEWRVRRPRSPADRVIRLLDLPTGPTRILLTGTVGSGKSTELFRIAEARAGKEFVLFLDLDRHFTRVVGDPAALRKVAPGRCASSSAWRSRGRWKNVSASRFPGPT